MTCLQISKIKTLVYWVCFCTLGVWQRNEGLQWPTPGVYCLRILFQFCSHCGKSLQNQMLSVELFVELLKADSSNNFLFSLQPHNNNNKFKTSMCRDHSRGGCPRGAHCTFAHSEEELERQVSLPYLQQTARFNIKFCSYEIWNQSYDVPFFSGLARDDPVHPALQLFLEGQVVL